MAKSRRRAETEARVHMVVRLLGKGKHPGEIKKAIATKYNVKPRTVEWYITDARKILLAQSQKSATEHRAESYALYLSIAGDEKASHRDRLKARERIDKLLALELQHGEAIPTDDDARPEASSDRVANLRAAITRELAKRGAARSDRNGDRD